VKALQGYHIYPADEENGDLTSVLDLKSTQWYVCGLQHLMAITFTKQHLQ